jgi:hypothetical protein
MIFICRPKSSKGKHSNTKAAPVDWNNDETRISFQVFQWITFYQVSNTLMSHNADQPEFQDIERLRDFA